MPATPDSYGRGGWSAKCGLSIEPLCRPATSMWSTMSPADHGSRWPRLRRARWPKLTPAGALQPIGTHWSLDWAIGAEDRWHVPTADPTVRQRLVANATVVETLCKVPSGDAIARTYTVNVGEDAVVFRNPNDSAGAVRRGVFDPAYAHVGRWLGVVGALGTSVRDDRRRARGVLRTQGVALGHGGCTTRTRSPR